MVKEYYGRHDVSSIQVLIFVSVCVAVFLTSIFLFKNAFYYFIGKIFLIEAYPFKKNCQIENFRNCLSTKRAFIEQVVRISL